MTGNRVPLVTRARGLASKIPARELHAWFVSVPSMRNWQNSLLWNKLAEYREHGVTPDFVEKLGASTYDHFFHPAYDSENIIACHMLQREGIDIDYYGPLIGAGASAEDISRFWEDGVTVEYALALFRG